MKFGQWKKTIIGAAIVAVACMMFVGQAEATDCRLDWNGDFQIDMTDYLTSYPTTAGFYPEWYVFSYYPGYYPDLFPTGDSSRLDYDADGDVDDDDLLGPLDPVLNSEGYYVEFYIFKYYPDYYPTFFPEYDVCPPDEGCPAYEVIDVGGPDNHGWPQYFTELGGDLYFSGNYPGAGQELMVYNPISGQATLASDVNPGEIGSNLREITAHQGKLYFQAVNYTDGYDAELYEYDPETGNSTEIELNPTGSAEPTKFFSATNGMLYFRARDELNDQELWEYNPIDGGLTVYEIFPGVDAWGGPNKGTPQEYLEHQGMLYMQANGPEGKELYSFDLTLKQFERLTNIAPGHDQGGRGRSSYPTELTLFKGEIFFNAASDAGFDEELWIYTLSSGAVREIVIEPGQGIFGGSLTAAGSAPSDFTEYDDKLYMSANQVAIGTELFVFDPQISTNSVSLVFDSFPGQYEFCNTCGPLENRYPCPPCLMYGNDGFTDHITLRNGKLYYEATLLEKELWVYDPATGLGEQLFDLYPGLDEWGNVNQGSPDEITIFDDQLVFQASTTDMEDELFFVSWAPENCP